MADSEDRSSRTIKLVSGEDIRAFNFFHKLSIFAVASIAADWSPKAAAKTRGRQRQRTPTDRENDGFPEWNHEVRFILGPDSDSDFVHVDLRHEGGMFGFGDRTVGEVRIPVKDLTEEAYQVKTSEGKANGVLNLSYRFFSVETLTLESLYPKVEEVPNMDLIDSSLSCYYGEMWQKRNLGW